MKKIFGFIKKHWKIAIIVVALLGFGIYRQVSSAKEKSDTSYTVKKQNLKETLAFAGDIDAEEKVTLRFQTSGRLNWVGVKEGDYVKKYQVIATLDQREIKKTLEKKLLTYSSERADFDQNKDDYETITSDTVKRILEKAQYDLNSSILDVEIQNLAVEYSRLFTPITGIVTSIGSPYAGVNITPAQAEFEVINPDTIFFSALVDQAEVVSLEEGKQGVISLDSFPDEKIKTKITSISFIPEAGESGSVYRTKLEFDVDNSTYKYRAGMTGDVEFVLQEKKNVLAVPSEFVKKDGSKSYVDIKINNKIEKSYVTVGETIDDMTEIKSGLKAGDVIYD